MPIYQVVRIASSSYIFLREWELEFCVWLCHTNERPSSRKTARASTRFLHARLVECLRKCSLPVTACVQPRAPDRSVRAHDGSSLLRGGRRAELPGRLWSGRRAELSGGAAVRGQTLGRKVAPACKQVFCDDKTAWLHLTGLRATMNHGWAGRCFRS